MPNIALGKNLRLVIVISRDVCRAALKERMMYGFLLLALPFILMANVPFMINDPEVFEAMKSYFTEDFGNASSVHGFGQKAMAAVDDARETVADFLNCKTNEVFFTSGATESDNIVIQGMVKSGDHIITSKIEEEYLKGVVVIESEEDAKALASSSSRSGQKSQKREEEDAKTQKREKKRALAQATESRLILLLDLPKLLSEKKLLDLGRKGFQ